MTAKTDLIIPLEALAEVVRVAAVQAVAEALQQHLGALAPQPDPSGTPPVPPDDVLCDTDLTAQILGVSKGRLAQMRLAGTALPHIKIGHIVRHHGMTTFVRERSRRSTSDPGDQRRAA